MLRTDVGPYDVHTVSALLKKPVLDAANMANYRPVSNLSFTSKVVERAVAIQLNEFWSQMICCHTTKNHSTETAMLRVDMTCRCRHMLLRFAGLDSTFYHFRQHDHSGATKTLSRRSFYIAWTTATLCCTE